MTQTQTWIIAGEQFDTETIANEYSHSQLHRPFSVAFFCPYCGDIWARRIVVGGDSQWVLWQRPCAVHPHEPSRGLSGSVWLPWDTEYVKNLPHAVLVREFLLHSTAAETVNLKDLPS